MKISNESVHDRSLTSGGSKKSIRKNMKSKSRKKYSTKGQKQKKKSNVCEHKLQFCSSFWFTKKKTTANAYTLICLIYLEIGVNEQQNC